MDADRARELLADERGRLEQALAGIGHGEPETAATDNEPGDGSSEELYQEEFDAGLGQDLAERLAALERAEARLAAGTYGVSVDSGEPIPDERLEALPSAERTVQEQEARGGT